MPAESPCRRRPGDACRLCAASAGSHKVAKCASSQHSEKPEQPRILIVRAPASASRRPRYIHSCEHNSVDILAIHDSTSDYGRGRTRQCFSKAWKMAQPWRRYLASPVVRHSTNSASTVSGRSRLCAAPGDMSSPLNITSSGASPAGAHKKIFCFGKTKVRNLSATFQSRQQVACHAQHHCTLQHHIPLVSRSCRVDTFVVEVAKPSSIWEFLSLQADGSRTPGTAPDCNCVPKETTPVRKALPKSDHCARSVPVGCRAYIW